MNALITGAYGLVGSAAVELFREKGYEVVGIDNNMRAELFGTEKVYPQNPGVVYAEIDIRDEAAVNALFKMNKYDVIIHSAAQPSHDWAKKDPLKDFDINARATLILLEATRKHCPEAVFIHVSTDKVYGENMKPDRLVDFDELETRYECAVPFKEDLGLDFAGKRSLFGCSKTAADIYVQEYGNYFGMKTACFRCGCITGKQHQGAEYHGFLAYLAKCVKEGLTYKIYGYKGKQVRDQIHASDLANAFWFFSQEPRVGEVYNMGGGPERSISVIEAIHAFEEWQSRKLKFEFAPQKREGDRIWDVHDVSKFRSHYPEWDYKYSLNDIVKELGS